MVLELDKDKQLAIKLLEMEQEMDKHLLALQCK